MLHIAKTTITVGTTATDPDLSRQIELLIGREPHDRVKCVRVFHQFYRCNWWSPGVQPVKSNHAFMWETDANHTVRKSVFLIATTAAGGFTVSEVARPVAVEV